MPQGHAHYRTMTGCRYDGLSAGENNAEATESMGYPNKATGDDEGQQICNKPMPKKQSGIPAGSSDTAVSGCPVPGSDKRVRGSISNFQGGKGSSSAGATESQRN